MKHLTEGCHQIPASVYHADPAPEPSLSASIAQTLITKSPRHAWLAHPRLNAEAKEETSSKFDLPTAVHSLFLEGSENFVIVDADSYRSKDAKEAKAAAHAAGKTPLLPHELEQAQAIVEAIHAQLEHHPEARAAFKEGAAEETLIWRDGGAWCRCRPDWISTDEEIWDLKLTGIDGPNDWQKHAFNMGYDLRVGFYRRGMKAVGAVPDPQYRFLVVEKNPPHAMFAAAFTPAAVAMADAKAHYAIDLWRHCLQANTWPGFPREICYVDPPPWIEADWEMLKERYSPAELLDTLMKWQAPHKA